MMKMKMMIEDEEKHDLHLEVEVPEAEASDCNNNNTDNISDLTSTQAANSNEKDDILDTMLQSIIGLFPSSSEKNKSKGAREALKRMNERW